MNKTKGPQREPALTGLIRRTQMSYSRKISTSDAATDSFLVREWRPFEKNTLRGFLSLELPSGLIIHGTLNEKNGSRWIGLPAREYTKDGQRSWSPLIEFRDRESREAFQQFALQAIDEYLKGEAK